MIENLFSNVICQQFEKEPGKNQNPCLFPPGAIMTKDPQAFLVEFKTRIDYDKEEGYRYLDLLIYGPTNYVQVWTRTRATVISMGDMEEDDGEMVPKRGNDYVESATEWEIHSDHDSCWRDAVQRIIFENRNNILTFGFALDEWYKVIPVPAELVELYNQDRKKRRGY